MGKSLKFLSESDRKQTAQNLFKVKSEDPDKGELHGLCPIHSEKNPSFSYNYKIDQYHCLSCTASGDLIDLYCKVNGLSSKEGFRKFCGYHGIESDPTDRSTGPSLVSSATQNKNRSTAADLETTWGKMPPLPEKWIRRLSEVRGWSKEIILRMDLRLQTYYRSKKTGKLVKISKPERVAIPIRDLSGKLVNIRLYKPGAKKMKMISWGKGYGGAKLFPTKPAEGGPVLLTEGDIDLKYGIVVIWNPPKKKNNRKTIRLIQEHLDQIKWLKEGYPATPATKFFRHTKERGGQKVNTPFGHNYFYVWWKKACAELKINDLDLYGGTRHTTTTELAKLAGEDAAKESSGQETNKAFERYCQMQGERAHQMANLVRKHQTNRVVKIRRTTSAPRKKKG